MVLKFLKLPNTNHTNVFETQIIDLLHISIQNLYFEATTYILQSYISLTSLFSPKVEDSFLQFKYQ